MQLLPDQTLQLLCIHLHLPSTHTPLASPSYTTYLLTTTAYPLPSHLHLPAELQTFICTHARTFHCARTHAHAHARIRTCVGISHTCCCCAPHHCTPVPTLHAVDFTADLLDATFLPAFGCGASSNTLHRIILISHGSTVCLSGFTTPPLWAADFVGSLRQRSRLAWVVGAPGGGVRARIQQRPSQQTSNAWAAAA